MTETTETASIDTRPDASKIMREIAMRCVERCDALKYRGKRADDFAIDFYCGACIGLRAADNAAAGFIETYIAMVICVRGMFEVRRLAAGGEG